MLSNLGRVGRWDGISTTNCHLSPAVPVSWPPTLNLHKPPELLSIHTIKRVEMTALAFCQPAKLAFYKAASICWLHPLHLLERKLNNLSRWLRRSQYSPSLGTASSPNTQTHAVLIHHSLLFLVQSSQSTGLSQPTSAFSASLLLLSAVQWSGYFKSEQWGKHLPQIPYEWKNWLPWKSLQEGMCVFKGHKFCYHHPAFTKPFQLTSIYLTPWYHTWKVYIFHCYIKFLLVGMFYLSMSFKPKYKTKCKRKVGITLILQYKGQLQDERKGGETRLLKMYYCYPNANNTFQISRRALYCTDGLKIRNHSLNTK